MSRKELVWLAAIFVLACSFRILFIFNTPYFSSTDSYFNLRIVENIQENHIPKFYDPLGYGGRTVLYPPFFYYTFYLFTFIIPLEIAAKLFSSIAISLLVIPIFLISKRLTGKTKTSLLVSFISIFIPANISFTLNTFAPYSLMIPLIFLTLYLLMDIKKSTKYFIFATVIGALLHPSFLLLIIAFVMYPILIKLAGFEPDRTRLEAILFSMLLTLWVVFVIYKNALLMHGAAAVWQNIPQQILKNYFSGINILEAIYKIGLVPLLAGILIIYKYISSKMNKEIYLLISFVLSVIILTALHLLKPDFGMAFTGIILTILFGVFLSNFWDYLNNARVKIMRIALISLILAALVFTNIVPSFIYIQKSIEDADITETYDALVWIRENTESSDVILSSLEEGHLVTYFAKRPNVIDENFLYQEDAETRLDDTNSIYGTRYSTEAISLLNKYNVKYVMFTPQTAKTYNLQSLRFLNEACFQLVYDKDVKIYKSLCRMI